MDDSDDEPLQILEAMEQKWLVPDGNVGPKLLDLFRFGTADFTSEAALNVYEMAAGDVVQLHGWALEQGSPEMATRVLELMKAVQEGFSAIVALSKWTGRSPCVAATCDDAIQRFAKPSDDKESAIQTVFRFILSWTARLNLRHKDDVVYKQIYSTAGLPTHAWVPAKDLAGVDVSDMDKLSSYICTKAHNADIWITSITVHTKALTDKMRLSMEPEFRPLFTTRAWLAFSDGIYGVYSDEFIPYEMMDEMGVPKDLAVCAYHKVPFAPAYVRGGDHDALPLHGMFEVDTPLLDMIMDTQELCVHTQFWLMAMLGRCLYQAGTLDNWQVCLYLKGRAGTGKSTLINLLSSIYEQEDTVVINNNAQGDFGLMQLNEKTLLWVAPEVKLDFNVDQASFQSLVSQERMCINRKHQAPFQGCITAPGALAGNTLPGKWNDNAGSIVRRLFLIMFSKAVGKVVNDLFSRITTEELPSIIRKINWCYRRAVSIVGDQDIWQSGGLSPHIISQNKALYASVNPLRDYLVKSKRLTTDDPNYWCPMEVFKADFFDHVSKTKPGEKIAWNEDFYDVPFKDSGLSVHTANFVWNNEARIPGVVVRGGCVQTLLSSMTPPQGGIENPDYDAQEDEGRGPYHFDRTVGEETDDEF